jgi:hypothetical protein
MSGSHRAAHQSRTRVAFAGGLTAGTLLLAPVGVAVATAGSAYAVPPGGSSCGTPGCPPPTVHKNIIRLPFVKIEIKKVQGQPPKIKVVPFPRLNHILHPRTPSVPTPPADPDE